MDIESSGSPVEATTVVRGLLWVGSHGKRPADDPVSLNHHSVPPQLSEQRPRAGLCAQRWRLYCRLCSLAVLLPPPASRAPAHSGGHFPFFCGKYLSLGGHPPTPVPHCHWKGLRELPLGVPVLVTSP